MTAQTAQVHVLEELDLALPLDTYARGFPARSGAFLLDGAGAPDEKGDLARFSMLGGEPALALRASRGRAGTDGRLRAVVAIDGVVREERHDAFSAVRALLDRHTFDGWVARPLPLMAGLVGYVGYEAGQMLERLPCAGRPSSGLPDVAFDLHRWILGARGDTGRAWLSVLGEGTTTAGARRDAEAMRDRVLGVIAQVEREAPSPAATRAEVPCDLAALGALSRAVGLRTAMTRPEYLAAVRAAKDAIASGDAFEICLTQRLEAPFDGDPWSLYRALSGLNPAPFAAMLDLPEAAIVSSSPERFLRLSAGGVAESRPIKGTRPRGATPEQDARLALELSRSPKDRAENAMIVDLVRSDLGRVCRFGTVSVPELCAVEPYATVHQLVSTVRGRLDEGRDGVDLLRACFPPGSMTGAPKIEAMSVLERLEPTERGPYSGALGYLDLSGELDLSVVIRTIVVQGSVARLHVGGAVVADSEPEAEHDEALHKARALVAALASASEGPHERVGPGEATP